MSLLFGAKMHSGIVWAIGVPNLVKTAETLKWDSLVCTAVTHSVSKRSL